VEDVLHMLPGVHAAVVGVADPAAGQVVKAFIVCSGEPLTEPEVIVHCRAHLEEVKVPRYIEFTDALPLVPSGKVRRAGLK
jgi:long-chain acyl-CoA synthetase